MTDSLRDQQLLREFSERGSEPAFASLVERHVDLVYATALRQVGQPPAAQEVAQNVFIALARKAHWLRAEVSLTGWLHKTTLLEARQWWRGEYRRQRREQTAVELGTTMKQDNSWLAALPPGLLDEGLLELREADRQAILLRFFEDRSHREIGALLGVGEDAIRKRLDKALDHLSTFFRRQGYAVPAGAAAVALRSAVQAAPIGLPNALVQIALSAKGGAKAGSLTLTLAKLMGLTKTQTGLLCAGLAFLPVAYQWHAGGELHAEQQRLTTQLQTARQRLEALQMQPDNLEAQSRLSLRAASRSQPRPATGPVRPSTLWNEDSNSIQIPKVVLAQIKIPAIGNDGLIMEEMARALELEPHQVEAANRALNHFSARYHELEAAHTRPTTEHPSSMHITPVLDQKTILCDAFPEDYQRLLTELKEQLQQTLGAENSAYFWANTAGSDHEEFDADYGSLPKRVTLFRPKNEDPNAAYYLGVEYQDRHGNWGSARIGPVRSVEELRSPALKSIVEDWSKEPLAPASNP